MKVYYAKEQHVIVSFGSGEMRQALGVLKALAKYFNAPFILNAAEQLERDLQPKLGYDAPFHLCEKCTTEIDTRKGGYRHTDGRYTHLVCPILKKERPV